MTSKLLSNFLGVGNRFAFSVDLFNAFTHLLPELGSPGKNTKDLTSDTFYTSQTVSTYLFITHQCVITLVYLVNSLPVSALGAGIKSSF